MKSHWDSSEVVVLNTKLRILVARALSDKWIILWPGITGVAEQYYLYLQQGPLHGINVIALDPPGHGLSEDWPRDLTPTDISLIWRTILEQFDISDATIGGHSYGGYCALMDNTIEFGPVKKVILLDGGYEPAGDNLDTIRKGLKEYINNTVYESWQHYLDDERKYVSYWDEDLADALKAYAKEVNGQIRIRMTLKAAWNGAALMDAFDPLSVPRSYKPVLLLHATLPADANEQRASDIAKLAKRLKRLAPVPVPHAGHSVITDNRDFVMKAVWAFMDNRVS